MLSAQQIDITGEKPLPNSNYKSLGIFAQDEFKLFEDKLSTTLGLAI